MNMRTLLFLVALVSMIAAMLVDMAIHAPTVVHVGR